MTDTKSLGSELMELGRFYYEREDDFDRIDVLESLEQIIQREKTNHEMNVLRDFVSEFSPMNQREVNEYSYEELFDVVNEIVFSHYNSS